GRGVNVRNTTGEGVHDMTIRVGDGPASRGRIGAIEKMTAEKPTVGDGAVATVGGDVDRIDAAPDEAGQTGVRASIDPDTGSIAFTNTTGETLTIEDAMTTSSALSTTATDLGIAGEHAPGSFSGRRVLAGLNTTLVSSLNGGR